MTRNALIRCLLAAVLAAPFAALAQSTDPAPVDPAPSQSEADTPMQVTGEEGSAQEKVKPIDHFCLQNTGSLISARRATAGRRCAGIGRSYSQEDLRRTGEIDVADALRRLDSSIY